MKAGGHTSGGKIDISKSRFTSDRKYDYSKSCTVRENYLQITLLHETKWVIFPYVGLKVL